MDVVELTKRLVSIKSVTSDEHEIAEFIASQLDFADVETQNVGGFGPNVIAKHVVNPDKPIIILNCHMDTVSIMEGWETDPFTPKIEDNRLYGLGSCDMKAGVAIAIDVFKNMIGKENNVIFTAVSDEEGNSKGAHLLLNKLLDELGGSTLKKGLCLIPEDTDEKVKLGARGRYVVEITVKGRSAHGAIPEYGNNAIEDAAKIVDNLKNIPLSSHPKLGNGSICVLKIQGGGNFLSVPDRCTIRVDRHTVIGETKEQIMRDFEEMLNNLQLKCSFELTGMRRETPFLEPYLLEINNPWAKKFLTSYKKFYGNEPEIAYGKSVGDFNAFGKIMPTIVFGPKGENAHGPNEFVYIDSIVRCRDLYLKSLESI